MAAARRAPEVLAPAGSPAALLAALQNGADAVYFGLQDGFNARARAANFALADLPATVAMVHRAGARAYVTMNTLVFEGELALVERLLAGIADSGVDALIVQDPAVCLIARELCAQLELHASTQMTIADADGAELARGLGVTRVVVPRELSVQEIERFAGGTDLELEVFVHGALCVSWSGQCLTSEAWGGRSANRGQCAQSCRMPYELVLDGEVRPLANLRYLLSPKDLAGVRALPELVRIGVHGLKIEGRQKSPQYVATATGGYRRFVDALQGEVPWQQAERQLANDLLAMELSYSRGFSDGFLAGSDHQHLVEGHFPKHRGVPLGEVCEVRGNAVLVRAAARPWTGGAAMATGPAHPVGGLSSPLAQPAAPAPLEPRAGMGVVFDQGDPEDPDEPGGPLFGVQRRGDGWELRFGRPGPDLTRVRPGDRVFVTQDPALAVRVQGELVGGEPHGRLPLSLEVRGAPGTPMTVIGRSGELRAEVASATPLGVAQKSGLDEALLRDKLGAFGGTPFHLAGLDASALAPGCHLPPSELKELRRALVQQLAAGVDRRLRDRPRRDGALQRVRQALAATGAGPDAGAPAALVPLVRSDEQLVAAIEFGVREVQLDWMEFTGLGQAFERARAAGLRVTVATTRVGKPGEQAFDERIRRLQPDGILVRHFGALVRCVRARGGAPAPRLIGDFSLNVTNAVTARHLLALGLEAVTASFDLDERQLLDLARALPQGRLCVTVHHRIPTFHTEHCLYAHLLSNGRDFHSCGRPCERHHISVRDHLQREHPVIVDVGCRNTVFHHAPQQAAALVPQLQAAGVRRFHVEFVREHGDEVRRVLQAWTDLLAGRIDAATLQQRTGAAPQIGVATGGMTAAVP